MRRTLTAILPLLPALAAALAAVPSVAAVDDSRDALEGDDVTIVEGSDRTVYEYRQNGYLRIVRIVPRFGRPYYLVPVDPTRGFGDLDAASGLVPSWRIVEFP